MTRRPLFNGSTVLIAEDSTVVRAVLRQSLVEHGYRVLEADDGVAALRMAQEHSPDVVLLDIEMPGLNGHQVLTALKADPILHDLPVVFLTGRTTTADLVEGLRLGAHDYLKKPFEGPELIARVSAAVRVKTLQDELRTRNADLEVISCTDVLTGLYNRRHLVQRLDELASAARRHRTPLAAIMLDLDHFKSINDSGGHAAGDAVLCEFARRLRVSLRTEDVAGRWGGEEFLILLPAADMASAMALGNRVCAATSIEPVAIGNGMSVAVTVSAGCAVDDGHDVEGLVRQADDALYEAKAAGRNRVMAAA